MFWSRMANEMMSNESPGDNDINSLSLRLTWLFDVRKKSSSTNKPSDQPSATDSYTPISDVEVFVSSVDFWNHNKAPKSYRTARQYQIKTNFWQTVILPPYPYLLIWVFGEFGAFPPSLSIRLARIRSHTHTWLMLSLNNNHHECSEMAFVALTRWAREQRHMYDFRFTIFISWFSDPFSFTHSFCSLVCFIMDIICTQYASHFLRLLRWLYLRIYIRWKLSLEFFRCGNRQRLTNEITKHFNTLNRPTIRRTTTKTTTFFRVPFTALHVILELCYLLYCQFAYDFM